MAINIKRSKDAFKAHAPREVVHKEEPVKSAPVVVEEEAPKEEVKATKKKAAKATTEEA